MSKLKKNNTKIRIGVNDVIKCIHCNKISKVSDWDLKTFNECTSREMRREYISLTDNKAFKKTSDTWYMCPCCKEYNEGYKLKIERIED